MIEEVKEWLSKCPYLKNFKDSGKPKINVERSDANTNYYEIEVAPVEPIIKRFITGIFIRQLTIELKYYTNKLNKEIENQQDLDNIVKWLQAQNNQLPAGWYAVEVLSNAAVYEEETSEQTAMYLININIQYLSEV